MKVALIGATGNAGSRILRELLNRGHSVTAFARNISSLGTIAPKLEVASLDARDAGATATAVAGHDAVVSAAMFTSAEPATLISAIGTSGVRRYVVVGGAGTLEVAPGMLVIDSPGIPAEYRPEMEAGRQMLELLRESDLDWTFVSPGLELIPGERTGQFRTGDDKLLIDDKGVSRISLEDFAVAIVDELEQPSHVRRRFTISY